MDCVAPPSKVGDAIHQCPRADSWLLRGFVCFDHGPQVSTLWCSLQPQLLPYHPILSPIECAWSVIALMSGNFVWSIIGYPEAL